MGWWAIRVKVAPHGPLTTRSPALPDFDHDSTAYPSLDDAQAGFLHPGQIDLARHRGEFACVQIGGQSLPGLPPPFQGTYHGMHTENVASTDLIRAAAASLRARSNALS
jgi:hypothetical protein